MRHLLVTNDFPPKLGGIQSYLWELWRRLPPEDVTVLTSPYAGASAWDRDQPYRVERTFEPVLLPHPGLARRVNRLAAEVEADLIIIDPVLPLGAMGRFLDRPYGLVLHGAEITMPGRLPVSSQLMGAVLRGATLIVSAGGYPLAEAERAAGRALPAIVVPPGVDVERFQPRDAAERAVARERFGLALDADATLITSVSRLVPRKGMDVLIEATSALSGARPGLHLAIAGAGRDRTRLERLAERLEAPVSFLGRLADADLPAFYGCGDVFAMLCRDRWLGLEQEGFGIVFLEAAAAGVAQVAGRSGGSHEAVEHDVSGLVVDEPGSVHAVAEALAELIDRPGERHRMALAGRARVEAEFSYDLLAARLANALDELGSEAS